MKNVHLLFHPKAKFWYKNANFFAWEEDGMMSVGFTVQCGRPHGAEPPSPFTCVPWAWPPPCGCHKWM